MLMLRTFLAALLASCFALPCLAEKSRVVISGTESKEMKRAAHRLRIPVEQLENAREVLDEAAELVGKVEPYPAEQLVNLVQLCEQVNRPKAKEMLESFIGDLRSRAGECPDFGCYARLTSAAVALMQSKLDHEKTLQQLRSWPQPKESFGEGAKSFLAGMETQVKRNAIYQLIGLDPERALELVSETNTDSYNYGATAQIAQSLVNMGRTEQAEALIDRTIDGFNPNTADPQAIQQYENFARMSWMSLDAGRAETVLSGLTAATANRADSGNCSATLQSGNTSVELTCSEYRLLNLLRSYPVRPALTLNALESFPDLKSKMDAVGGIDALYGPSGAYGTPAATLFQGTAELRANEINRGGGLVAGSYPVNVPQLMQQLQGKAESDPSLVRGKLKDLDINALINFAGSASYQDPELASIALDMAKKILPEVDPLEKRSLTLQSLVRTTRHVDGEVDTELIRTGFSIADRLKEDASEKCQGSDAGLTPNDCGGADQLESFLVSELSRDHFDSAIDYARSIHDKRFKLTCLIQILQAQMMSKY